LTNLTNLTATNKHAFHTLENARILALNPPPLTPRLQRLAIPRFEIGSVDTFERELEETQRQVGIKST